MPTPMTAQEYAQTLIDHFNAMRPALGDKRLRPTFTGAKMAMPHWLDPEEDKIVREAFEIAEKALFPSSQQ